MPQLPRNKFLRITVPVTVVSIILFACLMEVVVRLTWNEKKGRPGFYITSDTRIEQLAANYDGWVGGVPVRVNNLGFRDLREYDVAKRPNTFRILVLGDSVTFGGGSIYESTYPYLLEQKLKRWRPDVDWQVWNLGVPGYNTMQELMYLREVGRRFQPDLVVVGYCYNDVFDNGDPKPPGTLARLRTRLKGWLSSHFYSYHLYKKAIKVALARFSPTQRALFQNLRNEELVLARVDTIANMEEQRIGRALPAINPDTASVRCTAPFYPLMLPRNAVDDASWRRAVAGFAQEPYRVVFFINIAPDTCVGEDQYFDGLSKTANDRAMAVLGAAAPTVSSYEAFARFRPSQMPLAAGHSLGNSNDVKAQTLFEFLVGHNLVPAAASR